MSLLPEENKNGEIIINGKAQVVDILKRLPEEQKNKILGDLKKKNPTLSKELKIQTLSFHAIIGLESRDLRVLLEYLSSPLIAISIARAEKAVQIKFLKSLDSKKAMEVYRIITSETSNYGINDIEKAQNKILDSALILSQRQIIQLV